MGQFFQNLLAQFVAIQIPAGTVALIGGGLAGAFGVVSWRHVIESLVFLAIAFFAANIVSTVL